MRRIHFDCPSGAAGDMIMAALVDAGADFERLRAELHRLPLHGWELVRREVRRGAFRATKIDVEIDHHAHHAHRALGDILAILRGGGLAAELAERAARIFTRLADAEARVHGSTREEVRFAHTVETDAAVDRRLQRAILEVPRDVLDVLGDLARGVHREALLH
jgi:uncharacterized protein (DUF111 family)